MHGMSTKEVTSQSWLMFSKLWSCYNEAQEDSDETNIIQLTEVFANHSKDNEIYPLTVTEIVDSQKANNKLNSLTPKSVPAGTKNSHSKLRRLFAR